MKQTIAEQIAAAEVGLTTEDVRRLLAAFLQTIAQCPACEDEGTLTFAKPMVFPLAGGGGFGQQIPAGAVGSCPRCGGLDAEGKPPHDPEYVKWHCRHGNFESDCHHFRQGEDLRLKEDHAECGYRVLLPLPEADQ